MVVLIEQTVALLEANLYRLVFFVSLLLRAFPVQNEMELLLEISRRLLFFFCAAGSFFYWNVWQ
jgi:hypothetical protein